MKGGKQMKHIITIFLTATVSVVSQLFLPFAVNIAYTERGYFAIGGEYGLVVLSLFSMVICIDAIAKMYMNLKERHKEITQKYISKLYQIASMNVQEEIKKNYERVS